jgi:hypothetical protein
MKFSHFVLPALFLAVPTIAMAQERLAMRPDTNHLQQRRGALRRGQVSPNTRRGIQRKAKRRAPKHLHRPP